MYQLSVIIPVYNVEAYIERCATSLFEQTLSDVEFIFVNDNTPDASIEVLDGVSRKFPNRQSHIKVVTHKQNMGLAAARISGIKMAQGEYITFCDSDDWVEPEMYEKMLERIIHTNSDMVYSNYYVEYQHRQIRSNLVQTSDIKAYCDMLLCGILPSFAWIRLYRKSLFMNHLSDLYRVGVDMWEDVLMNTLLMPYMQNIAFEPFAGYHYNQCNMGALTKVWSKKARENVRTVVELVSAALEKYEIYRFCLSCFRLNAVYSIASHSNLEELKKLDRSFFVTDVVNIWKHPYMAYLNKLYLVLLFHRAYVLAWGLGKCKRFIKKLFL